jgi:basic membrane lipoprotein Med (substrate-binding protein (PBP1-ABC) superfamily)
VKRSITIVLAALCVLLLSGCWNGRILFSFEQPFWSSLGEDLPLRLALARDSLRQGYLPRFIVAGPRENPAVHLARDVSAAGYSTVVVGPLLSYEWRGYVTQSPRARFILIGGGPFGDLPGNALALVYDRAKAFQAAGYAAGLSERESAPGVVSSVLGARIGVLLSASPSLSTEETEGFASGVAEALEGGHPTLRVLPDGSERGTVKTAVEQMRGQGAEIFLLGMGSLNPWCLEVMKDAGGCAVVADWAVSGAFPEQVFLSVEDDILGGIAHALAPAASGLHAVSGPTRIVSGRALPVPEGAKSRIGGG